MHKRTLGKTDYRISEIGLGCWQLGGDFGPVEDGVADHILSAAWEQGVDFWDTADVYGGGLSEERIGQWLKRSGKKVTLATKVGRAGELYPDRYSKAAMRASLEGSARRLGVDRIDLAQLHCVPFEVLQAGDIFTWMEDFQQSGLIRHFGASVETLEQAYFCLGQPQLATLQIIFNLFRQDAIETLLPQAQENNVGIIVRLPLASGLLAGKYLPDHVFAEQDHRNYNRDGEAFSVGETFSGIPFARGVTLAGGVKALLDPEIPLAQQALRWILDQPAVSTVICGVSRERQVAQNAAASRLSPLSADTHRQLAEFYRREVKPLIRGGI